MKARGVRMHGKMDLRLEEFELPPIKDDEMLVRVVSDSICMSTYKMATLGSEHKRVPANIAEHPVITGHEFAGDIVEVGAKYKDLYKPGQKFTIQPALNYKGSMDSPGYSYEFCGGDCTYCILPMEVFDAGCFLVYEGEAYYEASLAEPLSCSIGAFHAAYHTQMGVYIHRMGIREGGNLAIIAGAGPMGLGALTYAIHRDRRPGLLVVTDINQARLDRAAELFPPEQVEARRASRCTLSTPASTTIPWRTSAASPTARATTTCSAMPPSPPSSRSPAPSSAATAASTSSPAPPTASSPLPSTSTTCTTTPPTSWAPPAATPPT